MLHRVIYCLIILVSVSLYGDSNYILCIEGGGSKTILQVMTQEGQIVPLHKDEILRDRIVAGCSNINTIGAEGVRIVFRALFEGVLIEEGNVELACIVSECRIVAGMAGLGTASNRQAVAALFSEWGIRSDRLVLMTDADMALQLVGGDGMILISGTGSICLGKKDGVLFRVGGLGRILGDEGSGYQIGLQAIKAGLAEEYGWGSSTRLTPELMAFFSVENLRLLIPQINQGVMLPSRIASCAPLVFTKAWEKDAAAEEIIERAAKDLGALVAAMIQISGLSEGDVHLWGGVFKNPHADLFLQTIRAQIPGHQENFHFINQANNNAAVLFAAQHLVGK